MAFAVGAGRSGSVWAGRGSAARTDRGVSCDVSTGSKPTVTTAWRRLARDKLARS